MLEGVVLQQMRGGDLHPSHGNAQQHHQEDALVHGRQHPDGPPKRRKRGVSNGANRIYTDAPLKVKSNITDDEPRKVGGRFEI